MVEGGDMLRLYRNEIGLEIWPLLCPNGQIEDVIVIVEVYLQKDAQWSCCALVVRR